MWMGQDERRRKQYVDPRRGRSDFDGSVLIIQNAILEVRATPGDDHLHEQGFDNRQVDVGTQEFNRKGPTVGFSLKPSSHPLAERCSNAPNTFYLLPRSQPSSSSLCLAKVSSSLSRCRRPATASLLVWRLSPVREALSVSMSIGLVQKGTVPGRVYHPTILGAIRCHSGDERMTQKVCNTVVKHLRPEIHNSSSRPLPKWSIVAKQT